MAVQWGLAGQGFDASDVLQSFGQAQDQRLQVQRQQAALAAQQRQQEVARQAGGLAARGDFAGAKSSALNAGAFDIAGHIGGLEEDQRKQVAARAQTVGALAIGLKSVPAEQRAARFQALAPQLIERGFDPQQLAQVDLSDGGLDGYISFATSADDALKAYAKAREPFSLSDGEQRFSADGKVIASNDKDPPKADWIFDSESGSWLQKPGTGAAGFSGGQPGTPAATGGGTGSRASRNNNPGNIIDSAFARSQPGYQGSDGRFAIFSDANAGAGAQAKLLGSYIDRGFNTVEKIINRWAPPSENDTGAYVRSVAKALNVNPGDTLSKSSIPALQQIISRVEGGPGGSSSGTPAPSANGPGVINVRAPKAKDGYRMLSAAEKSAQGLDPAMQYQVSGKGQITPIGGQKSGGDRKVEADYRKEFQARQDVKTFEATRTEFRALRSLALDPKASAQDDIAVIFSFMKSLDPNSTVREGEFATAQNAGGIPDQVRNAYGKALNGERLAPRQRQAMVRAAYKAYQAKRDAYNQVAEQFRGYAKDNGVNPDRVARTYTPDKPAARSRPISVGQSSNVGGFTITRVK